MGIPAKLKIRSEGKPNGIRDNPEHHRKRSDAGNSIVQEVFGFVKKAYPERAEEVC